MPVLSNFRQNPVSVDAVAVNGYAIKAVADNGWCCRGPENDVHTRAAGLRHDFIL